MWAFHCFVVYLLCPWYFFLIVFTFLLLWYVFNSLVVIQYLLLNVPFPYWFDIFLAWCLTIFITFIICILWSHGLNKMETVYFFTFFPYFFCFFLTQNNLILFLLISNVSDAAICKLYYSTAIIEDCYSKTWSIFF